MFTHGKYTGNTRDGHRARKRGWRKKGMRTRAHPCRAFPGERRREHGTLGDGWRGSADFARACQQHTAHAGGLGGRPL